LTHPGERNLGRPDGAGLLRFNVARAIPNGGSARSNIIHGTGNLDQSLPVLICTAGFDPQRPVEQNPLGKMIAASASPFLSALSLDRR